MSDTGFSSTRRGIRLLVAVMIAMPLLILGQTLIDPSEVNVYCTVIASAAAAITVVYCLRPAVIERFPVSTMAVLGFCVTTYGLAVVAQTLDRRPLIFNLLSPRETFERTIAFQFVILAAHATYAYLPALNRASQWLARNLLMPIWVFRSPRVLELWALGAMGIGATWVSRILFSGDINYGNVSGKFLQALVPFIVAPFFIPFRGRYLDRPLRTPPGTTLLLVAYFALVVATAVFFNARGIFAVVVLTIILAAVLMMAMNRLTFSRRARLMMGAGALLVVPVTEVAQDLATAMQIARGVRSSGDPFEIAQATVTAFGDKETLQAWRKAEQDKTSSGGYSGYSEIYLNSEFLQRLTYTKYTDLTMTSSLRMTDFQRKTIRHDAYEGIVSILPTPLINLLGLPVDKTNRNFSTGDIYASFAFNQELGGERTGSSITNAMDVLDVLWPPVIFVICILTFILLDSYSLRVNGRAVISTLSFILLYEIFARGLIYDSFRNYVDGITRAYVQAIFIYTVLTLVTRIAVAPIGWPKARLAPALN